jgi:hypothetical protein
VPQKSFDDPELRAAMTAYLDLAQALDEASLGGGQPRSLLDLAEAKSVAAMQLRKRLEALGWSAPASQRSTT